MICSDGDLMEGVSYESASLAGTNGLGKLIYFYDDNHITIDGTTSISFTEDRGARFEALGWHVQHVEDVNDLASLREAIANAQAETRSRRSSSSATHIAFGAPHAVDTAKAHGSPLGADEVAAAKKALGWDPDKHFFIPDEVAAHMNAGRPRQRGRDGVEDALRALVGGVPADARALGRSVGGPHRRRGSCPSGSRATTSRRAMPARRRCRRSRTPCRR